MPLLGEQPLIAKFLNEYGAKFQTLPRAVVLVTAHWEEPAITVSSGEKTSLYFDYGGFPKESYEYTYPAPGSPDVAMQILGLLQDADIKVSTDSTRGWDHGVFVPMMLMFPSAEVPIVQMSLRRDQDAGHLIKVGLALRPLRRERVLFVGSGASFHNFKYFFARDPHVREEGQRHSRQFDKWLRDTIVGPSVSEARVARLEALQKWKTAPSAQQCHPEGAAEHLLPLMVIAGVAGGAGGVPVGDADVGADSVQSGFAFSQFEF